MTRAYVLAALLVISAAAEASEPASPDIVRHPLADGRQRPNDGLGLYVQRPTIMVSDLDRALGIWRDVLGFSLDGIGPLAPPGGYTATHIWGASPDSTFRFATLSVPGRQSRAIGLGELTETEIVVPEDPQVAAVLIQVEDMAGKLAKLRAMGLTIHYQSAYGPNAEGLVIGEVGFRDHDGHLIVMFEENPGAPWQ